MNHEWTLINTNTRELFYSSHSCQELLLHCARFGTAGYHHHRIIQLATAIRDWAAFLNLTIQQRMLPLVYKSFATSPQPAAPDHFCQKLHRLFLTNAARNIRLTAQLLMILERLHQNGIQAVPYKGPVLAQMAYGAGELRNYHDLDLLVARQDFFRARDLLMAQGYRPQFELESGQQTAFFQSQNELTLLAPTNSAHHRHNLDLHWELVRGFFGAGLDLDRFSANLAQIELEHRFFLGFTPEDSLLILVIHGGKHLWQQLLWICDLAHLIEASPINWERVLDQAQRLHVRDLLFTGLLLTRGLFASSIPDAVLALAQKKTVLTDLAARFTSNLYSAHSLSQWQKSKLFMQMRERTRDKVRYLILYPILLSFNDIKLVRLPHSLYFLYYWLRPLRVSRKWLKLLVRRCCHFFAGS